MAADDDPGQDRGRDRREQQQEAQDRQRGPAAAGAVRPVTGCSGWRTGCPASTRPGTARSPSRIPRATAISSPLSSALKSIGPAAYRFAQLARVTVRRDGSARFNQLLPEPGAVEADSLHRLARPGAPRPRQLAPTRSPTSSSTRRRPRHLPRPLRGARRRRRPSDVPRPARAGRRRAGRHRHAARRALRPDPRQAESGAGAVRPPRCPEPLACVVTRSGELPLEIPLFAEPEAQVIVIFSGPDRARTGSLRPAGRARRASTPSVRSTPCCAGCGPTTGSAALLCEGGPTAVRRAAARAAGRRAVPDPRPQAHRRRHGPTITTGPSRSPSWPGYGSAGLLERNDSLYLRYRWPPAEPVR